MWCDILTQKLDIQMLYSINYLIIGWKISSITVISLHLHLLTYIRRFGPVHGHWMYLMERLNSWISRCVLNRRFPESTIMAIWTLIVTETLPCDVTVDVTEDIDLHEMDNSLQKERHVCKSKPGYGTLYYKLTQPDNVLHAHCSIWRRDENIHGPKVV